MACFSVTNTTRPLADYDVIFLGCPIWHGQAPRIISTFLEGYDLTGKTIVPVCTSRSSGIAPAVPLLPDQIQLRMSQAKERGMPLSTSRHRAEIYEKARFL